MWPCNLAIRIPAKPIAIIKRILLFISWESIPIQSSLGLVSPSPESQQGKRLPSPLPHLLLPQSLSFWSPYILPSCIHIVNHAALGLLAASWRIITSPAPAQSPSPLRTQAPCWFFSFCTQKGQGWEGRDRLVGGFKHPCSPKCCQMPKLWSNDHRGTAIAICFGGPVVNPFVQHRYTLSCGWWMVASGGLPEDIEVKQLEFWCFSLLACGSGFLKLGSFGTSTPVMLTQTSIETLKACIIFLSMLPFHYFLFKKWTWFIILLIFQSPEIEGVHCQLPNNLYIL